MKTCRAMWCFVAVMAVTCPVKGDEKRIQSRQFTYLSSLDNTELMAMIWLPQAEPPWPVMILQHGYMGDRSHVRWSGTRLAQKGFLCISMDLRGWGASKSVPHDDGGIEIMDLYDGLQAAGEERWGKNLDMTYISMIGYSNGGGAAYFATVRFPYLFRGSLALFGIPDYGQWITLNEAFRDKVIAAVGGTPAEEPDRYLVRRAKLAAGNLHSGTRFHIAYDEEEKLCPIVMNTQFIDTAREAGIENIFLHVSKTSDANRWKHGYNNEKTNALSAIEDRFVADLEANGKQPIMPDDGELVALGFLITPKFRLFLGTGENAAARITYAIKGATAKFKLTPLTSDPTATARLTLPYPISKATVDGTLTMVTNNTIICRLDSTIICQQ